MTYVEEKDFAIRFELRCSFPDDYDGDEDGYEWVKEFPAIAAEIVQAAAAAIRARGRWTLRPGNRGRPAEDEITLVVERTIARPEK